MARAGECRINDTNLHIWEDEVNETEFRKVVYSPLIRRLRDDGWNVRPDPRIVKNYSCLSQNHRLLAKGPFLGMLELSGRHLEIELWSACWPIDNRNGRRYDYNKRKRMCYLTGMRCDLTLKRLQRWLAETHGYTTSDDFGKRQDKRTPMEKIQAEYASSCHTDKTLGHPPIASYGNDSADGERLQQGQVVWVRGRDGRPRRGNAYYSLNNRWMVVTGGELIYASASELHSKQPANLRRHVTARDRRVCLETLINEAVAADDFSRAAVLRRVLFGDQPLYRIWSDKHGDGSYWGPAHAGYVSGFRAGRYTYDEALQLVSNAPNNELKAVPIGDAPAIKVERRAAA